MRTLVGCHIQADGARVDLNNYEICISLRFGDDFFAFDRVVPRRVTE